MRIAVVRCYVMKRLPRTLILILTIVSSGPYILAQEAISTMDFVQILDGRKNETLFYYENNWKVHREKALAKGYIKSYQLLEAARGDGPAFDIVLITTYANQEQYNKREENFGLLIEAHGERKLLNDLQPSEFRSIIFSRDPAIELVGGG